MKLKPVKRKTAEKPLEVKEPEKKPRKSNENNLPSGKYEPIYLPQQWLIRDYETVHGSRVRQFLEVTVKRNDSDFGLPYIYLAVWQDSERYTGYLKGKSTSLPVSEVPMLQSILKDFYEKCRRDGLIKEYETE